MTPERRDEDDDARNDAQIGDFFAPLVGYRRLIWRSTLAATCVAIVAGGIYYFAQPSRWSAFLEFRPVF
ncbi:MAG TPA: hypothetical protein VMZ90_11280, partial [Vicinamibacterales bacterium]|nr:hypothetical protein [Vicinamibacterales bacterium]